MSHGHLPWKRLIFSFAAIACAVGLVVWLFPGTRGDGFSKPPPAKEYSLSSAEVVSLARLADSGNGKAAMRLGYYYQLSAGSRTDAVKWFEKAKANGVREAEDWLREDKKMPVPLGDPEPLRFTGPVTLAEAATRFNEKFLVELTATSQAPLTEAELRNALALGNGSYLRPEKSAVADLCVQYFETGVLPKGSSLSIWVGESIGRPEKEHFRPFFLISLGLTAGNAPEGNGVADPELMARSARIPVRLLPRKADGR